ncbi:30S ribosomal protein S24 [Methanocalculus chunghsingensis]|uniref:Small ribosomal subunit protein eS24 n=1 Tax=Methanocalculus chunghsingensis TaxID=156457 RepID=A0A8J7WBI4_9EURY|nr:30S ribosomal protein S24e [Methanocalculus chunghsingensis]MBR1369693.1 30S ribosomal protein S24 [Methanocalculus chunghsingensis]
MEITITNDTRNELLYRKEVEFTMTYEGATPSRKQIIGKIAALLNAKEETMVLDPIKTRFGSCDATGVTRIYDTVEARDRTERPYLINRGQPKAEAEE